MLAEKSRGENLWNAECTLVDCNMESSLSYQKALDETNSSLVDAIPSPTALLSDQLNEVFTPREEERIEQEENENGAQSGTRLLLKLLRKKDRKAFDEFLRILQDPDLQLQSLYLTLFEKFQKHSESASRGILSTNVSINTKDYEEFSSSSESVPQYYSLSPKHFMMTPESFLKDIPPSIAHKLVRRLNVPDGLGKDWRGIAGCLNLTHEQTLESSDKMKDMLDLMIQQKFRIKDLLQILEELQRYDVVELFTGDEKWVKTEDKAVQT